MTLESIKNARQQRPRRILLFGKPKAGKSTLASQAAAPIFIPIRGEEGIDDIDVQTFPVAQNFGDVMEAMGVLYSGQHQFQTIVIDSVSTLEILIWDETRRINGNVDSIEKVGGGFNKGYTEALKQWRELIEGLDALRNERDMSVILIGHVKVEKFNDPSCEPYDRYTSNMNKHATALLTRWSDGILFAQHKIVVKKDDVGFNQKQSRAIDIGGGKLYIYTQERPSHPGGGRGAWGYLPYELPLSWAALEQALAAAQPQRTRTLSPRMAGLKMQAKAMIQTAATVPISQAGLPVRPVQTQTVPAMQQNSDIPKDEIPF